jgi:hypothetical protein
MIEEYPELVLSTYKKMRENGELRTVIPKETTAALKNACLKVYDGRYNPEDADILSVFFNVDKMGCDFRKVISNVKSDYFKALWKHIRDKTETTDERNSDLLAWLIDFKPRPSGSYYKNLREVKQITEDSNDETNIITNDKVKIDIDEEGVETGREIQEQGNIDEKLGLEQPIVELEAPKQSDDIDDIKQIRTLVNTENKVDIKELSTEPLIANRYNVIACIILLLVGCTSFVLWENSPTTVRMPNADERYMYWDGDHYEPIKDDQQKLGVPIIALDLQALKRQRRINLPDTMTKYSLGKVWHIKIGNIPEFYTDSGMHPVDTARRLRPMSTYIQAKYNSYPRYLLTHLVWFICAAFFIALCGLCISKLKKEKKDSELVPSAQ